MATLRLVNVVNGVGEGRTLAANALQGVLANDQDPYGYPLSVTAVASASATSALSSGSVSIKGAYGTLVMHADGSYSYVAADNISLPADRIVQDSFTLTIDDRHGNTGSAVLTVTVMQPGDRYVGGTPSTTVTGGNGPTVLDGSLGNQTVHAGNGPNVLIGGPNDTLTAGNGPVTIIGGANDTITVGNGPDTVVLGTNDTITVGNGPHSFIFDPANGIPTLSVPATLTVGEDGTVALLIDARKSRGACPLAELGIPTPCLALRQAACEFYWPGARPGHSDLRAVKHSRADNSGGKGNICRRHRAWSPGDRRRSH